MVDQSRVARLGGAGTLVEIQEGFDRNKKPLTAIYNHVSQERAGGLGDGKIVLSFGVAPDGSMTHCEIVSSTFKDPEFEKLLVQRAAMINFGARDVPQFEYADYPIQFIPR